VLFDGAPLPKFASADYRVGELDGITYGIKFGKDRGSGGWSARLEWYHQTGAAKPNARVGALNAFDLYPDLDALIAQFTFKLGR
jgi:hypothetical protein